MIKGSILGLINKEMGELQVGHFEYANIIGETHSVRIYGTEELTLVEHDIKPSGLTHNPWQDTLSVLGIDGKKQTTISIHTSSGSIQKIKASQRSQINRGLFESDNSERKPISGDPSELSILKLAIIARDLRKARKTAQKAQRTRRS